MQICIVGANGRMGQEIEAIASKHQQYNITGKINFATNDSEADDAIKTSDVIVDFSLPEATVKYLNFAKKHNKPYVIGTTGFNEQQEKSIAEFSNYIPIVKSGNMSLGVIILAELVNQASKFLLNHDFDISIYEMNNKNKLDAHSGKDLLLGYAIKQNDPTKKIDYTSTRGGTVIGDHKVTFAGNNERIILSHFAQSRDIFANGALKAAAWVKDKLPNLYSMRHVLNIEEI